MEVILLYIALLLSSVQWCEMRLLLAILYPFMYVKKVTGVLDDLREPV